MAYAQTIAYDVRWRQAGSDAPWTMRQFPADSGLTLPDLERGLPYDIELRSVAASGRVSTWVTANVSVAPTNRLGALALPTNIIGNQTSMWGMDTEVTYAASSPAEGAASATISMSAGTLVIGGTTINYSASTASVTGTAGTTRTFYLYYDDPRLQGGTHALGVVTNIVDTANVDGRIAIGSVTVQFPAAGSSGGGGGGIGGGGGGGGSHQQPQQIL